MRPAARSTPSLVAGFAGDLAALVGAAIAVTGAPAVPADPGVRAVVAGAGLLVAGLAAHLLARTSWREGPALALAVLLLGGAPAVIVGRLWWVAVAGGTAVAVLAPHLLPPGRARVWVVSGALLGLAAIERGWVAAGVAMTGILVTGELSGKLARGLAGVGGLVRREREAALDSERNRSADLETRLAHLETAGGVPRRSLVRVAFSRRLGAIGAIANAIARDLRLAGAAGEPRLRDAAIRCAEHAGHVAQLASGGAAREEETTLSLLLPRVSEQLAGRILASHHFDWKVPTSLRPVAGSSSEWVQILAALAENALAAMPSGGLLTIEAFAADTPGRARIVVEDNGRGIAPDLLPDVLEPFRTSRSDEGAEGLGLALVASLVEALEGTITVASTPGHGTRIDIDVPFYAAAAPATAAPARFEGTVLLSDDSRDVRRALRRLLESFGLDVVESDSGTVALALFAASPKVFRVLMLDVVMPGTPVEEVVVRAREIRPDLPVVLLSGYDVGQLLENVVALGGVRFLTKPLERESLVATLRDLFTVRQA